MIFRPEYIGLRDFGASAIDLPREGEDHAVIGRSSSACILYLPYRLPNSFVRTCELGARDNFIPFVIFNTKFRGAFSAHGGAHISS